MPEPRATWVSDSPWAGIFTAGRLGQPDGPAGLVVEPRDELALASLIAAPTRSEALLDRFETTFGIRPPSTPAIAAGPDVAFIWSGRDQWLAMSSRPDLAAILAAEAGELAAVADQSASRAVLRLSGASVREVLAKGCPIDLHPDVFQPGDAALTLVAHIGVQIWRPDETTYEIAVSRSYAGSFWSWLSASAAEAGCEVVVAGDPSASSSR